MILLRLIFRKATMLILKTPIILMLSLCLSACEEPATKNEQKELNKIDIYRLTNVYNSEKLPVIKLNERQQNTINEIILGYELFLTEKKEKNFPSINQYAIKQDWTVEQSENEDFYQYMAQLKDGSGASILFKHHNLFKDTDIHKIAVWGLTSKQCNYLVGQYKYKPNFQVSVAKYRHEPSGTSTEDSSCSQIENNKEVAVLIEHNTNPYGNDYDQFNSAIEKLFNKEYEQAINMYHTGLYFSQEPASHKVFRHNIDYAINTTNNHITIGYVTKDKCKEIIYHLDDHIQYNINNTKECKEPVNTMEFFK